ncbi:zinc-binding dehydrogenase [Dermacoccus nishinomiyaensis]|uniref:zinc-binding dehydrogenase n=1 Tax=Dermacoccus nishinomiyaensis TaxID=1274 RepID=UPI000E071590|nr:zinc-binding dehydrogenase [Dermacoccus nishinomiyaensis]QQY25343.1 zinc-binding dehydrogenase [Dermacoccus nishinomiyaensis]STD17503.1 L-threonine 3-dehydrogenase [Dermacoccus nishinomiyaensis]
MDTMKAARLDVTHHTLNVEEVPVPTPGPGQAVIEVKAAGVCLSDVHLLEGLIAPQFLDSEKVTLGHEVAGVVTALGDGVPTLPGIEVGSRVLLQAGHRLPNGRILTRGVDYDGGYAEYALAQAETLVPIPDDLPFEQAAIIPDAVSTPWAAIQTSGRVRAGEAVGVWGLGGLGIHAVQLLRLIGASPIVAIDPLEAARERALAVGADVACAPEDAEDAIRQLSPRGLDVAFDFAGVAPVRAQAMASLAPQGRLVIVGLAGWPIEIPSDTAFAYKQLTLRGHYGSEGTDVHQLVALTRTKRLDLSASISGVFPLEEAPEVLERLARKDGNPIRFILHP